MRVGAIIYLVVDRERSKRAQMRALVFTETRRGKMEHKKNGIKACRTIFVRAERRREERNEDKVRRS